MSTDFAYLPPLPPIAVSLTVPTPAAAFGRGEYSMVAMTVLLTGITALAWTTRLDTTDSQILVTFIAVLTVILPEATFTLLRANSRRH
jgi:hypothetical protein